jgi:hypothetical protein
MQPLDYRVEVSTKRRSRLWLALLLAVLTIIIYGLWDLEHTPYRPPSDMRTLLGDSELALVRGLIRVFAVAWIGMLLGLLYTFRPRRDAA